MFKIVLCLYSYASCEALGEIKVSKFQKEILIRLSLFYKSLAYR